MLELVTAVSRKSFVRTIARKRDRHGLTRQLADPPGWQCGCIGERFVKHRCQRIDMIEIVWRDLPSAVIRGKALGHLGRITSLIQRCDIEADRAGLDRIAAGFRHQGNHCRAIDTARQERPKRHIGHHSARHSLPQQVQQFCLQIGGAALVPLSKRYVPPLAWRRQRCIVTQ